MGSDGNVSGGGGGAYRLVRSRSLNFFPINDRALSTCCCVPEERSDTSQCFRCGPKSSIVSLKYSDLYHLVRTLPYPPTPSKEWIWASGPTTHPLCDRSETPVYKAGWRCRSSRQSSASENSRISLASQLIALQDAVKKDRQKRQ